MPLLTVRSLTHSFADSTCGLTNISCTISEGEQVVIAGRNGAGKSLLALHLCGLRQPTSGALYIDSSPSAATPHQLRTLSGMVFQHAEHQIVGENVLEDLLFGLRNIGVSRR